MKTILFAILLLCLTPSVLAVSPHTLGGARKAQGISRIPVQHIAGTILEYRDTVRFATDRRVWNVDNPQILTGHKGHYVRIEAQVYSGRDVLHITEVRMPTASQTSANNVR